FVTEGLIPKIYSISTVIGLVPITVLIEYIFGIRPSVTNNEIIWDINLTDEFGIKQYPYGKSGLIDFQCKKRKSKNDTPKIKIYSNTAFNLKLKWQGGSKTINVKKGINTI
ncbi:MAG: hypothetical protein KA792_04440, partial [Bacteroidales bacterium]|nr:hypothetical protein [Bacteroidales bacterium]